MRDLDAAKPDVIVMDIQMPGMNGIEGVRAIKGRYPSARVLMQTAFEDEDNVFDAICAGANGYILKTASNEEMMKAIRDVHMGGSAMTPTIAFKVLERFRGPVGVPAGHEEYGLSDREKQVLTLPNWRSATTRWTAISGRSTNACMSAAMPKRLARRSASDWSDPVRGYEWWGAHVAFLACSHGRPLRSTATKRSDPQSGTSCPWRT